MNPELVLILDNIRSLYNVGSIFRIADGAGVEKIYLTGITGYPEMEDDSRKPWEIKTVSGKIHKTALGAEATVEWEYIRDPLYLIKRLQVEGYKVIALEKNDKSVDIFDSPWIQEQAQDGSLSVKRTQNIALIVGNELDGVSKELLRLSDHIVHIPMRGTKKSLNVSTATAVAVYELVKKYSYE